MNTWTHYEGGTGVVIITPDDLDALIDEVYGKPGLGVDDSAGLFDLLDPVAEAYELGGQDYAAGRYAPPFAHDEHVAYIKGQNDAWAAKSNVTWWRRSERNNA